MKILSFSSISSSGSGSIQIVAKPIEVILYLSGLVCSSLHWCESDVIEGPEVKEKEPLANQRRKNVVQQDIYVS